MTTLADVMAFLGDFAPPELAADWDNVGLLLGDPAAEVRRVMTCLTITPESAEEAVRAAANLVVAHHPLPFKPLGRIVAHDPRSRLVWQLASAGIAIYSPHTAFDSAARGINQQLAERLGLSQIQPLLPSEIPTQGTGRQGSFGEPLPVTEVSKRLKQAVGVNRVQITGSPEQTVERAAIACGSGASLLGEAIQAEAQAFITGEARFHDCLAAEAAGVTLLLCGHYASERFAVEDLAQQLQTAFARIEVWASRDERDPLTML